MDKRSTGSRDAQAHGLRLKEAASAGGKPDAGVVCHVGSNAAQPLFDGQPGIGRIQYLARPLIRGVLLGIRAAKNGDDRRAHGGRNVHRARVAADVQIGTVDNPCIVLQTRRFRRNDRVAPRPP